MPLLLYPPLLFRRMKCWNLPRPPFFFFLTIQLVESYCEYYQWAYCNRTFVYNLTRLLRWIFIGFRGAEQTRLDLWNLRALIWHFIFVLNDFSLLDQAARTRGVHFRNEYCLPSQRRQVEGSCGLLINLFVESCNCFSLWCMWLLTLVPPHINNNRSQW